MSTLERYRTFIEIVERGSLTAASKRLNCSLQSVSRALAALEDELGIELVRRTTRRLQTTPAGMMLYGRLRSALRDIDDARAEVKRTNSRITGLLRIGGPVLFGPKFVVPAAAAFLQRFPDVEIDLVLSDSMADLIEDRLDFAVRIGNPGAGSLRSRSIGQLRRVLVASETYLARHGRPRTPEDLSHHLCVVRSFGPEGDAWPLKSRGEIARTPVSGVFRCNDAAGANAAVLHGAGIGLVPLWQVRQEIDDGRLEILLPEYEPSPIGVTAVWPSRAGTPPRTRLFIDMLAHRLAGERI